MNEENFERGYENIPGVTVGPSEWPIKYLSSSWKKSKCNF